MKPIHIYKLAVYLKDDSENLNAEEIQEAIKTELDGTYYLNVFEIEWQGVVRTDAVSHEQ
jgi:hypothetical protein